MSIDGESLIEMVDSGSWDGQKIDKSGGVVEVAIKTSTSMSYKEGFNDLVKFSIPSILTMVSRRMIDIISYIFIGRLADSDFIAGAGLGIVTSNVMCYAVTLGLAGGIDTLSSQAFGSKNNYMAGCYLNRAQVIV
jgi:Na+-driven multidrug efflux pump